MRRVTTLYLFIATQSILFLVRDNTIHGGQVIFDSRLPSCHLASDICFALRDQQISLCQMTSGSLLSRITYPPYIVYFHCLSSKSIQQNLYIATRFVSLNDEKIHNVHGMFITNHVYFTCEQRPPVLGDHPDVRSLQTGLAVLCLIFLLWTTDSKTKHN